MYFCFSEDVSNLLIAFPGFPHQDQKEIMCNDDILAECKWNTWIWYVLALPQIVLGTFGNILSIIVLSRRRLKIYSISIYLICLSCADMVSLLTSVLQNFLLNGPKLDLVGISTVSCKSLTFISHAAGGFSVWLLVIVSVERMFLSKYPVSAKLKLTRKHACRCAAVFLLLNILLSSHLPFGMDIKTSNETRISLTSQSSCDLSSEAYASFYKSVYTYFLLCFVHFLPVLIIVGANSVTLFTLFMRRKMITPSEQNHKVTAINRVKSSARLVIFISVFFVLTTAPFFFYKISIQQRQPFETEARAKEILIESVLHLIAYSNFTFNFVFYIFNGSLFSQELRLFLLELKFKFKNILGCSPEIN